MSSQAANEGHIISQFSRIEDALIAFDCAFKGSQRKIKAALAAYDWDSQGSQCDKQQLLSQFKTLVTTRQY
jgi:hypothetical protein